jgi:phage tail sheath protein FI
MTYLSPGVYVEEVPSTSRPLEGVGTSIAAFIGLPYEGPFKTPLRVAACVGLVAVILTVVRQRRAR